MINLVPLDLPPAALAEYRKRIEHDLAEVRRELEPLETGEMHIGTRPAGEEWRDVTQDWIAHHKRTIAIYEGILTTLGKQQLPS